MSLRYGIDVGYGVRVVERPGDGQRPGGHIVEIHFYDRSEAVKYADQIIREASEANERLNPCQ
jgi:hypothetical protein